MDPGVFFQARMREMSAYFKYFVLYKKNCLTIKLNFLFLVRILDDWIWKFLFAYNWRYKWRQFEKFVSMFGGK